MDPGEKMINFPCVFKMFLKFSKFSQKFSELLSDQGTLEDSYNTSKINPNCTRVHCDYMLMTYGAKLLTESQSRAFFLL